MEIEIITYLPELISVSIIAIFMSISPGADFVVVSRNSMLYGRRSGLYSSLGVSLAIWLHVAYSIAGLALIISNSIVFFSIVKYIGAGYLIYIGWKTFTSTKKSEIDCVKSKRTISSLSAFKTGFITNALNPKTTIFFLSIFTQVVNQETPLLIQITYGAIISMAHLIWFSLVSFLISHPVLLKKFNQYQHRIEKVIGVILIGFGLKVATSSN